MNFAHIPRRLACIFTLQIFACLYATLVVGMMIKVRNIHGAEQFRPISEFSLLIKNFGWLLWILPAWWFFYHVRRWDKDGADFALLGRIVATGIAVFLAIVICAYAGTQGALRMPLPGHSN